ncbi:DUF554 domain-containing protein [Paenibacillus cremeus]|uniref:DUF554 domain-containing protein n=1 Tax=Paenibacillus cremeus TaxID=2163881 RepID=A0A559KDN3_9BACL|nr:DUF554 domain-containing protein [Paenibacillus cremeus]TVY10241.1 DUF554 domain-containing protein [Paenibacillus cremeus]
MALWGTIVNAAAIILGGLLGLFLQRMSDSVRNTVMQGIGMALVALGLSMALKSGNFLLIVGSLVVGGVLGELINVEKGLERLGAQLERGVQAGMKRFKGGRGSSESKQGGIAVGFVNTTLIYCVGAMAILGAMDSGLRGDHVVLYTKSMLDGFTAIIFASTMGVGVLFSSVPVFLYQGIIALASSGIASLIDKAMLDEIIVQLTAVGGILIMGIGVNMLEIRKINVANLLPSLAVAAVAVPLVKHLALWWAGQ